MTKHIHKKIVSFIAVNVWYTDPHYFIFHIKYKNNILLNLMFVFFILIKDQVLECLKMFNILVNYYLFPRILLDIKKYQVPKVLVINFRVSFGVL